MPEPKAPKAAEKPKPKEPAKRAPAAAAPAKPAPAPPPAPAPQFSPTPGKKRTKSAGARDAGLGVPIPKRACKDPKCPFHGSLRVRGSVFDGSVVSAKMKDTVVVERAHLRFIPKYERFESRTSRILAHNPPCIAAPEGASVRIAECRPLSKKVAFCVVADTSSAGGSA
jgi:small subunit ribosomal protein S17